MDALAEIKRENRLRICEHSLREFVKNRDFKLRDLVDILIDRKYQISRDAIERIQNPPLLQNLNSIKELDYIGQKLSQTIKDYRHNIDLAIEEIRQWGSQDPVSRNYSRLLKSKENKEPNVLYGYEIDDIKFKGELEFRNGFKIPPGYEDSEKNANTEGDLYIWLNTIELAKQEKRDVVFVTNDRKSDWFTSQDSTVLFPRFELVEEFHRKTGKNLCFLNGEEFFSCLGLDSVIIDEIETNRKQFIKTKLTQEEINQVKRRLTSYDRSSLNTKTKTELKQIVRSLIREIKNCPRCGAPMEKDFSPDFSTYKIKCLSCGYENNKWI